MFQVTDEASSKVGEVETYTWISKYENPSKLGMGMGMGMGMAKLMATRLGNSHSSNYGALKMGNMMENHETQEEKGTF